MGRARMGHLAGCEARIREARRVSIRAGFSDLDNISLSVCSRLESAVYPCLYLLSSLLLQFLFLEDSYVTVISIRRQNLPRCLLRACLRSSGWPCGPPPCRCRIRTVAEAVDRGAHTGWLAVRKISKFKRCFLTARSRY